jgi:hypothetical protein
MLLAPLALAAEPAFWSADAVSGASALFARAQARDGEAYEKASSSLEHAKADVADLDLAVAWLGSPPELTAYAAGLRRQLAGQFLRLQKHVDLLGADYSRVFGAAVERALPSVGAGWQLTECAPRGMAAMLGRPGAGCPGRDLSPALAAAVDADLALKKEIDSILAVEWPSVTVAGDTRQATPVTGEKRWVNAAKIARTLGAEALRDAETERDAAIEALDLEAEDEGERRDAIARAEVARRQWASKLAGLGVADRARLKKALEKAAKKGGPAEVGLCANPAGLGGCSGEDVTASVVGLLVR